MTVWTDLIEGIRTAFVGRTVASVTADPNSRRIVLHWEGGRSTQIEWEQAYATMEDPP